MLLTIVPYLVLVSITITTMCCYRMFINFFVLWRTISHYDRDRALLAKYY